MKRFMAFSTKQFQIGKNIVFPVAINVMNIKIFPRSATGAFFWKCSSYDYPIKTNAVFTGAIPYTIVSAIATDNRTVHCASAFSGEAFPAKRTQGCYENRGSFVPRYMTFVCHNVGKYIPIDGYCAIAEKG